MGGYAGNAGLFSTASEVFKIAQTYLAGGGPIIPRDLVKLSLRNYTPSLEENRGVGVAGSVIQLRETVQRAE